MLAWFRDEFRLPAAAATWFSATGPTRFEVVGVHRAGSTEAAALDDLWHFGSIGKSLTTTAIAREGVATARFDWSRPVRDLAPGFVPPDSVYAGVSLSTFLAHRTGLPVNPPAGAVVRYLLLGGDPEEVSRRLVSAGRAARPRFAAGSDFLYSNLGYGLAGLAAARALDVGFRHLITTAALEQAGMPGAAFGVPGPAAPREHRWSRARRRFIAVAPRSRAVDDLAVFEPSGCVHGTIADLAAHGVAQLRALLGSGAVDRAVASTHEPVGPPPQPERTWRYALGWTIDTWPERPSPISWHAGSTGGTYAFIGLDRASDSGFALVANAFRHDWGLPDSPLRPHQARLWAGGA